MQHSRSFWSRCFGPPRCRCCHRLFPCPSYAFVAAWDAYEEQRVIEWQRQVLVAEDAAKRAGPAGDAAARADERTFWVLLVLGVLAAGGLAVLVVML